MFHPSLARNTSEGKFSLLVISPLVSEKKRGIEEITFLQCSMRKQDKYSYQTKEMDELNYVQSKSRTDKPKGEGME